MGILLDTVSYSLQSVHICYIILTSVVSVVECIKLNLTFLNPLLAKHQLHVLKSICMLRGCVSSDKWKWQSFFLGLFADPVCLILVSLISNVLYEKV